VWAPKRGVTVSVNQPPLAAICMYLSTERTTNHKAGKPLVDGLGERERERTEELLKNAERLMCGVVWLNGQRF